MIWVDLLVLAFLAYFLIMGYFQGFIRQFVDLTGLVLSFLFASFFYQNVSKVIDTYLSLPVSLSGALGFFIVWFFFGALYYIVTLFVYKKIPKKAKESKYNRYAGVLPALLKGIVVTAVILTLFMLIPLSTRTKEDITNSKIGGQLVEKTAGADIYLEKLFGRTINDTLAFLTVRPESDETVELGFRETKYVVDEGSEEKMLDLVNKERASRGLNKLAIDPKLRDLARKHSVDMFENGYFSHTNLKGKSPFDRMTDEKIRFLIAGENLALAPNVEIAHNGLMNSPGHRANILTPEFGRVGFGIMSSDTYGRMFTQEFTD